MSVCSPDTGATVSVTFCSSVVEDDRQRGTRGGGSSGVVVLVLGGFLIKEDDAAVVITLVEHFRRQRRALPGPDALVLVDLDLHATVAPSLIADVVISCRR